MAKKGLGLTEQTPKAIVCLGEEIKLALLAILGDYPDGEGADYAQFIEAVPLCELGMPVGFAESSSDNAKGPAKTQSKGRSAYQQFVSDCMKGKNITGAGQSPTAMKECAAEWQASKV